jgi:lysophospholipid acyltransferase (LPLAT)-like uncharacterized protein
MDERRRHQQTTGRRRRAAGARLWMIAAAVLLRALARILIASCRVERIDGTAHLEALIATGRPTLLCCWHRRLSFCVAYLLAARKRGLKPGFLVSPSRDGELVARVASGLGAQVLRGSAHRTGARALRALYVAIREGVSPILHPDGPHGPARIAKPGSLMLAQMTRTPLLPLSFAADRYWQLNSWDKLIIPKPFARITLCIGEPLYVASGADIDARAAVLAERLDALDARADGWLTSARH